MDGQGTVSDFEGYLCKGWLVRRGEVPAHGCGLAQTLSHKPFSGY